MSCSDWSSIPANGQCEYTPCELEKVPGKKIDGSDCFSCQQSCDTGCGTSGWEPATKGPWFDFSNPCCNHDHCYYTTFSQTTCDDAFLKDMLRTCGASFSFRGAVQQDAKQQAQTVLLKHRLVSSYLQRTWGEWACQRTAQSYHLSVAWFGESYYAESQQLQRDYMQRPDSPCKSS